MKNVKIVLALIMTLILATTALTAVAADEAPAIKVSIAQADGVVSLTATLPEGVELFAGNIVISYDTAALTVAEAKGGTAGSTVNAKFADNTGIKASFATATAFEAGTTVLEAKFNVVEGATVTEDSIQVDSVMLAGETAKIEGATYAVEFVGAPEQPGESAEEPSEGPSEEPSGEPSEEPSGEPSGEPSEGPSASEPESPVPPTGDAGLVVFAILAVLAVAGIVLAKKRA